jgi:hypothetical protein
MIKSLILTSFFALAFVIEYLDKREDLKNRSELISRSEEFDPWKSNFFVHNEIEIATPPEAVWNILIDTMAWESRFLGAKNVSFVNPGEAVLQADSQFNWETIKLKVPKTTIKEFETYTLLAWESRTKTIQGYHVRLISPTETGSKVITEEAQNGWLTFFEKTFQGKKLHQLHDLWLAELNSKTESL